MKNQNIVSVSWGDHLNFGDGDGKLSTPKSLERKMKIWKKDLGAKIIHWRQIRTFVDGHLYSADGQENLFKKIKEIPWDDFEVVPRIAHENEIEAFLYVSLFDEGWPLPPKKVREISYHNSMHLQHVSWQSPFSKEHPEYTIQDRDGHKQWGSLCLAYRDVRKYFCNQFTKLLEGYDFDGLFVCFRSQSKPADFGDQFGFNEPIYQEYFEKYGKNILKEDFELSSWRELLGNYITIFLQELRKETQKIGVKLSVGIPRGDVLGPPLGNHPLQWEKWINENLIDQLIINQNSSQCPSMWHQLWPMHRGNGYLQNYLTGENLPSLKEQIAKKYLPVIKKKTNTIFHR